MDVVAADVALVREVSTQIPAPSNDVTPTIVNVRLELNTRPAGYRGLRRRRDHGIYLIEADGTTSEPGEGLRKGASRGRRTGSQLERYAFPRGIVAIDGIAACVRIPIPRLRIIHLPLFVYGSGVMKGP